MIARYIGREEKQFFFVGYYLKGTSISLQGFFRGGKKPVVSFSGVGNLGDEPRKIIDDVETSHLPLPKTNSRWNQAQIAP